MQERFEKDEYFILINGDIYTELNFSTMIERARSLNSDIMVGAVKMSDKSSYGEIVSNPNMTISQIIEKPERHFTINAGIYVLNQRVLKLIPNNKFYTMPQLIEVYLEQNKNVHMYDIQDYWIGIEDQEKMNEVAKRIV